ncbi:MAG: peptidyl-tRNA hydrolase, PTH1 family [Parcubacteria group bacterium Gr01-1014_46]|nr:MAG: peptidyl-tRNA hydrolase, PTH1 family [Parcubacteria group bacterium Gr01-1014_46]
MNYIFVGLGNPGGEYENTRHNTGRLLVEWFGKFLGAEWKDDKKLNAKISKVKVGKTPVTLVLPETFMNNSGKSVKSLVTSVKSAEKLLVIYDDLDLPFGTNKISFNKSSGGHRGLESIIKTLKTEKFARVRVGISPKTPSGKIKKPKGEDAVTKVIMGKYKEDEVKELKKLSKKVNEALETFVSDGLEKAMTGFN